MCQDTISPEDSALRTALENMRYAACTTEDINLIRNLKSGKEPNDPKLAQAKFRKVSIITATNAQRDRINQLGCKRFALENKQLLSSFYSIDTFHTTNGKSGQSGYNHVFLLCIPFRCNYLIY